jgi:hypothetical protein
MKCFCFYILRQHHHSKSKYLSNLPIKQKEISESFSFWDKYKTATVQYFKQTNFDNKPAVLYHFCEKYATNGVRVGWKLFKYNLVLHHTRWSYQKDHKSQQFLQFQVSNSVFLWKHNCYHGIKMWRSRMRNFPASQCRIAQFFSRVELSVFIHCLYVVLPSFSLKIPVQYSYRVPNLWIHPAVSLVKIYAWNI